MAISDSFAFKDSKSSGSMGFSSNKRVEAQNPQDRMDWLPNPPVQSKILTIVRTHR
jgi:hypothetical protein